MTAPDYGKAAADYAQHRQGFPPRLFDWIDGQGGASGDVLDLGTGTGLMARELARRGARVTVLDPSLDMLREANDAARRDGLDILHRQGRAEDTDLPDASFDLITAATCWHWFDRPAAARECARLLRPGGRLIIAHQDWLRRPGNVIDVTLQAIHRVNPPPKARKWTFQYPDWLFDLTDAGFADYQITAFPAKLDHTHDAWVGRIVASAQIGPALDPDQLDAFRRDFKSDLVRNFPNQPMAVEHRVFAICLWIG